MVVAVAEPRIVKLPVGTPDRASTLAEQTIALAARSGLVLDEPQSMLLRKGMAQDSDKRWVASRMAIVMPRQNGKDAVLEARELGGLAFLGETIIHSAHLADTAEQHFLSLVARIEESEELSEMLLRKGRSSGITRYHGSQRITFRNGGEIRFRSRTTGGGRGWKADCLIFNEAFDLPDAAMAALGPTIVTKESQVWMASSAVDQEIHENGLVLARWREEALSEKRNGLAYFEWSLPYEHPDEIPEAVLKDAEAMRPANIALGTRIPIENVAREIAMMAPRSVATERGGVGDWPDTSVSEQTVVSLEAWSALTDAESKIVGPLCVAFDVSPERKVAVAAAGRNAEGKLHVEIVPPLNGQTDGTKDLVRRLERIESRHSPERIVCAAAGPVASLLPTVKEARITVETIGEPEHAQACGRLVDLVGDAALRHLGTTDLLLALKGAKQRPLGDAWAWSRKRSSVNIAPLVAATLALWAADAMQDGGELVIW